eukprot:Gregarina_sp_Poly_1__4370@NODE_2364_length_2229_cov_78_549491_g1506_i0_p1_GENE_NODE_2364_length_2229_cov_78_549491_g1506_i0NODE_2364_length_2229_cov_78_549491_g1506_i0_p1_ORF_typecomplete_len308_score30_11PAP2/PF01569_21/2_2e03PAP2/PF01569_21/1_3e28PAP2_3/PF14378_6/7_5e07EamA/PF00892_20/5e02EamA/PF00892_20/0_0025DUF2070/PF09843_9/0_43DUF2070/PF09843_9/9_85TM5TMR_LYT/PF07694_12/365TM5TMR_LYT/PF07694_12/0_18Acyl_transf_3/PF01757_22/3_7Acyl_transf_3/PF01757_22/0_83PAP2_C/PF14360_6/4_3e02PAP2_C/PF14
MVMQRRQRVILWIMGELCARLVLGLGWFGFYQMEPRRMPVDSSDLVQYAYPYAASETLSTLMASILYLVSSLIWLLIILVFVFLFSIRPGWRKAAWEGAYFAFGVSAAVLLALLMTEMIKRSVGALRPDFLSRCFNVQSYQGLVDIATNFTNNAPINCPNAESQGRVAEGRLSFPSGHASTSFACFGFIAMYSWHKLRPQVIFGSWRYALPFLMLLAPGFVSLSRLWDNRHHPRDILAGMFLGLFCAFIGFIAYFHDHEMLLLPRSAEVLETVALSPLAVEAPFAKEETPLEERMQRHREFLASQIP